MTMTHHSTTPINILRINAVIQKTGIPKSTIYAYMKGNKFPKPISLGERSVGWLESDIDNWINHRMNKDIKI